ncbi:MAG: aldo/keto reductase [Dehalococcoidia bacterium]|nr:aldo/keto reductase [Dehalococcoidia bacterium]
MDTVALGSSGIEVSRLCLGTMQFGWTAGEAASFATLDAFAEAGGTFLDSADIYSRWVRGHGGGEAERMVGRWLAARGNRHRMVIATKVRGRMWPGPAGEGLGRDHIIKACEASLERLGVETIDLYQCHWADDSVPVEETLRAFEDLIRAGKVRAIGASNHDVDELREALNEGETLGLPVFVSLQPHYNLVHRGEFEGEVQDLCLERGLAVVPYSPLAKGFLTGKYEQGAKPEGPRANGVREYMTSSGWATIACLREIAGARGTTPAAVAVAWLLAQRGVTAPIVGANSPAQLAEVLPAAEFALTAGEVAALAEASTPGA